MILSYHNDFHPQTSMIFYLNNRSKLIQQYLSFLTFNIHDILMQIYTNFISIN